MDDKDVESHHEDADDEFGRHFNKRGGLIENLGIDQGQPKEFKGGVMMKT